MNQEFEGTLELPGDFLTKSRVSGDRKDIRGTVSIYYSWSSAPFSALPTDEPQHEINRQPAIVFSLEPERESLMAKITASTYPRLM